MNPVTAHPACRASRRFSTLTLLAMSILLATTSLFMTAEPLTNRERTQVSKAAAGKTPSDDLPASLVENAKQTVVKQEYEASWTDRGLQAPHRAHNLRTYFEPWGVRVEDRTAEGGLELFRLRTVGIGRAGRMIELADGEIHQDRARVENRRRGGIVEWYENAEAGVEHGYVLDARPSGEGELRIDVAFEGARVTVRDGRAEIATASGRQLEYEKLVVKDAAGRDVESQLGGGEGGVVHLTVDDGEAEYPLVVDPLLTSTSDATLESNQASAQMGWSVAGAGDVNGDGYADVIVGAYFYDAGESDEGAAFVFHGGPAGIASGNPATANATLESNQADAQMGVSVAGAGDVNGDSFADVIVGGHLYDAGQTDEGAAFVFHGGPAGIASGNPATANATLESNQADAQMGRSVAGAGDVNGDGYADVIVGAILYDAGETNEGAAFVFHGGSGGVASGNPATANATLQSNQADAQMGWSVAGAGDVNGDGYADGIVGAILYDSGQTNEGAAFVFHGGPAGIASGNPATANATLESNQVGAAMGRSVAGAGDVNGDGYADVIVGATGYDAGETDEGATFVFHGGAHGVINGNPATASAALQSNQTDARMGLSVAGAGDVNGDGYADVIVGAYFYDAGQTDEGAAFVFHGGPGGIASGNPATANATLQSNQVGALMGFSVAGAGDVNGDGYADVIVSTHRYDSGQTDEGAAFVFHGGPGGVTSGNPATANATLQSNQADALMGWSVAGAGDVNGDGYADVIVGTTFYDAGETDEGAAFVFHGGPGGVASGNPATANATLQSNQADAQMGWSVARAGDVNGDSYADVIVGAVTYDAGESDEGAAFVFHGGPTGIASGNPATANATLESNQADAQMARSVAGAGDVNGDGYADVIVGAVTYDAGETNEGAAFVFHGGPAGIASGNPATANATLESNQADALMGFSVAGAGDVNGDGYADVIVGAYFYDSGQTNEGAAFVFGGNGDGLGRPVLSRQLRDGSPANVEPWGSSTGVNFQVRMTATDPGGRGRVKLEIQAVPVGENWGGAGQVSATSPSWTDVSATAGGVTLTETVPIMTPTLYRWRARVLYAPFVFINEPANPAHGPWRRLRGQAVEADIRTEASCMVTCPANLTAPNDPGQCGATVVYAAPMTTGSCGTVTCTPASGTVFAVGTTTVNCTSTAGPTCSFTVTVVDNQNPTVTCPANVATFADTGAGAVVSYTTPTPSDNCPGATVVCAPASGSLFAVGTTTVVCTATDASSNTTQCNFTVTVTLPKDSVGTVNTSGGWFLNNGIGSGPADATFIFGLGTDIPVTGDWDGDGDDTAGIYRPSDSTFRLKNTNTAGGADIVFQFGAPGFGFVPVVGDWDGDGVTTIGLYQPSTGAFFIKNTNTGGDADLIFFFGPAGLNLTPIVGDWDGNGTDGVGLYDTNIGSWQLKNTVGNGPADTVMFFGAGGAGYQPMAGDWDNDGVDGIGVYIPGVSAMFLRNAPSTGPADRVLFFGSPNSRPVAGNWDNLP